MKVAIDVDGVLINLIAEFLRIYVFIMKIIMTIKRFPMLRDGASMKILELPETNVSRYSTRLT